MRRFYRWCARAWPFWVAVFVIGTHQGLWAAFPQQSTDINKAFSIGLQIVGGLLVLHSIDSTLGMLRGESIPRIIAHWFRSCPIWSKPQKIEGSGVASVGFVSSANLRVKNQASSLSQRVSELERQMDEVYQDIARREQALKELVSEVKEELSKRVGQSEVAIRDVKEKIDNTALGSIKQQIFGVVIAIYGAGISYFS